LPPPSKPLPRHYSHGRSFGCESLPRREAPAPAPSARLDRTKALLAQVAASQAQRLGASSFRGAVVVGAAAAAAASSGYGYNNYPQGGHRGVRATSESDLPPGAPTDAFLGQQSLPPPLVRASAKQFAHGQGFGQTSSSAAARASPPSASGVHTSPPSPNAKQFLGYSSSPLSGTSTSGDASTASQELKRPVVRRFATRHALSFGSVSAGNPFAQQCA
jgi:hypothetical protein